MTRRPSPVYPTSANYVGETLMRYGQGGRVPIPTRAEIDEVHELGREIVACSVLTIGPLNYMKVAFHSGDISMVYLAPHGAIALLRALKAIVPDTPHIAASLVKDGSEGAVIQEGHMSA